MVLLPYGIDKQYIDVIIGKLMYFAYDWNGLKLESFNNCEIQSDYLFWDNSF